MPVIPWNPYSNEIERQVYLIERRIDAINIDIDSLCMGNKNGSNNAAITALQLAIEDYQRQIDMLRAKQES